MVTFEMKRDPTGKWYYLNEANSQLYDSVSESTLAKDIQIKHLLEQLAASSFYAHCSSRY